MPYQTGTATDYLDLLDQLRRFACGYATWTDPVFSGTGNGTMTGIDTYPDSPTETWTITCTATATDGGTFSVTGSVSGAQADATVGTPYDQGIVQFTINDGTTDFALNDEFTWDVTEGALTTAGEAWVEQRWSAGTELILQGLGTAGTDEIYVGINAYEDIGQDYYNWDLRGYIGYQAGKAFDDQPGVSGACYCHLWDSAIPYWFVVNGRRIIWVAKVSTVYQAGYLGLFLPYGTPSQYPYPLIVGGNGSSSTRRWSATDTDHRHFADPGEYGLRLLYVDGTWQLFANYYGSEQWSNAGRYTWPWRHDLSDFRDAPDGSYPILPALLIMNDPANNIFGELDGVYWTSGFGAAAEDLIQIGATNYLVVQNVYHTNAEDYWALKLE